MRNPSAVFVDEYCLFIFLMIRDFHPIIYIIAGPNGAGKTTCAFSIMPDILNCYEYVNADAVAAGLSPFRPLEVSIEAGRLMLKRIKDLAASRVTFAFESTLASKSFAPFLIRCKGLGYSIRLIYIWIHPVELAIERVKRRVASGGHKVPEATVMRRYSRSLNNFIQLYSHLADSWKFFDNSSEKAVLVAEKSETVSVEIYNKLLWNEITHRKFNGK